MEATLTDIWTLFISSIDVIYIIMCNIATYAVIKMGETIFSKDFSTIIKRIISAVVAFLLGVFLIHKGHNEEAILYGFFIQFVVYDYLLKWLLNKLKAFSENSSNNS